VKRINILFYFGLLALIAACSKDEKIQPQITPTIVDTMTTITPTPTPTIAIPTYADDYASIAGWDNHASWNLANVHDPTVAKYGDYYYMYQTDASYGNASFGHGHFACRRSKDLVNWEYRDAPMNNTPAWVLDSVNNIRSKMGLVPITNPNYGHWAPVVRKVGNKYRMYYCIVVDNYIKTGLPGSAAFDGSWGERAFIGLMETDNLEQNVWVDKGMVVMSSTDRGNNWARANTNDWSAYFKWNAIDPSFIEGANGQQWLIYGSWHSGIVAVQINPATGKPFQLNTLADYGVRIARRENNDANRWQGLEAPEIVYNAQTGYYYLFMAYDELGVAYNTRVCRSQNITGPYLDYTGKDVTAGAECWPMVTHPYKFNNHSGWVGISHVGVFKDESTGDWYLTSQGRLPANTNNNPYSNALMMGHVRQLRWTENGWPVAMPERYAAVKDSTISTADLVGTWENITLNYQFQGMQTSQNLILSSNGTASGALTGGWSYDAVKKKLTIGSQSVYVERGLDWEANPRKKTIIYSGINTTGRSLWGKKVN